MEEHLVPISGRYVSVSLDKLIKVLFPNIS
jgi:hypothetical protein